MSAPPAEQTANHPSRDPGATVTAPTSPTTTASAEPGAVHAAVSQPYAVLRWLVVATFVVILNETIMVNAIPRLMTDFDVTARSAQWLSTAFMLTMAVVIPVTGWFLQRVTTRTAFTVAMSLFLAGTLLAAVSPFFWMLVGARVVQASGTAVMMPLLMTTLMMVVPEHDRGRVMGNVMLAISVAPALGPAVSGLVLQWTSWRGLFLVVLPIAATVAVLGLRRLEDVGEPQAGAVDWSSVAMAALGFGSLVYGLSEMGSDVSGVLPPVAYVLIGVLVVGVFAWRQVRLARGDAALLDLRTLTHRTFTVSLALQSVAFMAMLGSMILLPLYLQDLRGLSPLQTGLLVAPGGIAMGLLGPRVGRAFDTFGGRMLVVPGSVGVVAALATFSRIGEQTPYAVLLGAHLLLMVSLAALFTPAFTLGLGALPAHLYSHGSSMLGTVQQVAGAVGTALAITVASSRATSLVADGTSPDAAFVSGLRLAFLVAAAIALVVVVLAVLLPNRLPAGADAPHGH
jgi:DHA2 family lincomycin resistance protein-like MFS transporter